MPQFPPCSARRSGFSRGSGVVTLHSDTCAALWDGHGMAAEHPTWTGSSGSGARLPGCSAEQGSELVFPWVSGCHRSRDCDKAAPLLPCSSASSHPWDILLPTASDIQQIWKQT